MSRLTIAQIRKMKEEKRAFSMVTAYDYSAALIAEKAEIPLILVGDSLGMVMQGHETTLPVTVDHLIYHGQMVMRASKKALVVIDLPFLTYATEQDAITNARSIMQEGGGQAVKLEGGREIVPLVKRLTEMGVPVMGHLGLTPQSQHQIGLRAQAKELASAKKLVEDALALQEAGAFAVVLEVIPSDLAELITSLLSIPTIGIGAGVGCDGQVQVWHDLLGIFEKSPRHAYRFAEIGEEMVRALSAYREEVEARQFPTEKQSVKIKEEIIEELIPLLKKQ